MKEFARIPGRIVAGAALMLALCTVGAAAGDYPDRPIRLLVPGSAGGGMDAVARLVATNISETLKQAVVVENRPGAAGNVAVAQLAKSAPDGYTVVLGQTSQLAINPTLYRHLPYDPFKDFVPVLLLADAPNVFVVPASSPFKTLADVVAAAQKLPDGMDVATPGIGTVSHLTAELFARSAGIKLHHIPSRGATSALMDIAAGRLPLMLSSIPTSLGLIQSGEVRAIAVSARTRSPILPDVPTVEEQGYPGFDAGTWYGLLVPAGTPADVVSRLNEAGNAALKQPSIAERVRAEGGVVLGGSSAAFTDKLHVDNSKWAKVIKDAGIEQE
jgi:tripartite-type tricarboxylate transporter receptor subunit TctC